MYALIHVSMYECTMHEMSCMHSWICANTAVLLVLLVLAYQENLDEELQREIVHRLMREEVSKLKQNSKGVRTFHLFSPCEEKYAHRRSFHVYMRCVFLSRVPE